MMGIQTMRSAFRQGGRQGDGGGIFFNPGAGQLDMIIFAMTLVGVGFPAIPGDFTTTLCFPAMFHSGVLPR